MQRIGIPKSSILPLINFVLAPKARKKVPEVLSILPRPAVLALQAMWKGVGGLHGAVASDNTGMVVSAFCILLYSFHTFGCIFRLPCSPSLLEHQDYLIHAPQKTFELSPSC